MNRKLLIIDGSSMLTSNYYGTLPMSIRRAKTEEEKEQHYGEIMHNQNGVFTNAVYTTLKMLLKIWNGYGITHTVVVFDRSRNTFRRQIYPEYKKNRGRSPKPLKDQFFLMEYVLKQIGIPVLSGKEYEADDYAASLVEKFHEEIETVVMTKDHDYFQLADMSKVWIVQVSEEKAYECADALGTDLSVMNDLPNKVVEYKREEVKKETGVYPAQIPDLKGIIGDTSDNIPGVKGIKKPAPVLIEHYTSLEALYQAAENCRAEELLAEWKELGTQKKVKIGKSTLSKLVENKESAFLSKQLGQMKRDIPINLSLDDMELGILDDRLQKICASLDINYGKLM